MATPSTSTQPIAQSTHSGSYCLYFLNSTSYGTNEEYAILPEISDAYNMSNIQIRFWVRSYSSPSTMEVGVMTDPSNANTYVKIEDVEMNSTYTEKTISLNSYSGNGRYIALKCPSPTMYSQAFYVDDITVEETPAILTNQTVELHQGWNWFAPIADIALEQLETALDANGISINSQNQFARYDVEDEEWSGDLLALVPGQMYKIEVSADCNFTLTGIPTTSITINIEHGSNWFGYTGSETVTIEEALIGFTPVEGDKITSEDGKFTIYEDDEWGGDLLNLAPGKGYIYISQDTESKQFIITRNN